MSDQEDERPSAPVPVRVAVARQKAAVRAAEAARRETEEPREASPEAQVDPSPTDKGSGEDRSVHWDGTEWSVREEGLSRSGLVGDSGATLVSVTFHPSAESGRKSRLALIPGRTLSELSDFQLASAIVQGRDVSQ